MLEHRAVENDAGTFSMLPIWRCIKQKSSMSQTAAVDMLAFQLNQKLKIKLKALARNVMSFNTSFFDGVKHTQDDGIVNAKIEIHSPTASLISSLDPHLEADSSNMETQRESCDCMFGSEHGFLSSTLWIMRRRRKCKACSAQ